MIRAATLHDIPRLIELGALMHEEAPAFRGMSFDADKLAALMRNVMGSPTGFAMCAVRDGLVIGGMLAVATPHFFSPDLVACDLALFIAREHRGGMAAVRLLDAYRRWGAGIGAAKVQIGVMTGIAPELLESLCVRMGAKRAGVVMEF